MSKAGNIIITVLIWLFVASAVVASVFCVRYYNRKTVNGVEVKVLVPEGKEMLTDSIIKDFISSEINSVKSKKFSSVNDSLFTTKLMRIHSVKSVRVTPLVNGNILLSVVQKDPVAKVNIKDNNNLYMTLEGDIFYSDRYDGSYKLLTVNGLKELDINKHSTRTDNLSAVVSYILNESKHFLYDITESVSVVGKDEMIELQSRYGVKRIIIGTPENLEVKSFNLRMFCEAMHERDLSVYEALNLNFENQVIAITKN